MQREEQIFLAKLYEQMEMYEEFFETMHQVAQQGLFTIEERNLYSVSIKNAIGSRRAAWRILSSLQYKNLEKNLTEETEMKKRLIAQFLEKVEAEVKRICSVAIEDAERLFATSTDTENQVFYKKFKGDYLRYLAEITVDETKPNITESCLSTYNEAVSIAEKLAPTNPIRLGLALNLSVFYYEIYNCPETAMAVAKRAFDAALPLIDTLSEDEYKEATLIMQLLR